MRRGILMKRFVILAVAALAVNLIAPSADLCAQSTFKIPFKFKAAGKNYAQGEYGVAQKGDAQIALRKLPDGEEILIPFTQRLAQPVPPVEEPQIVFDMVGNFEPSYTEYVTEYVLAEVWFPGQEGFLIHTTKGAHQNKIIKGEKAPKE
jgi:hypothetical protein